MTIADMLMRARVAQIQFEMNFDQCKVDAIVKTVAKTVFDNAEMLSRLAVNETQMGVYEDKVAKCHGKAKGVWYDLRNKPSMGVIHHDPITNLVEIAKPIGVVAGITPMTNPVVTPMSKIMFALKTKNAIIIAPHPRARHCSSLTVKLINEAIARFNVPEGLVQVIEDPSVEKTQELMTACDVVVATGGMNMVKSAYSSGKPSYGVGAGNVQVILDRDIDFLDAAQKVIKGRTFDNGIICSGEQSFIYHVDDKQTVMAAFEAQGAYIVPNHLRNQLIDTLFVDENMNRDVVGKSALQVAQMAGIEVPDNTKVLVVEANGVGSADIISKEKMCPVLAAYSYSTLDEAISIVKINLSLEGNGHTAGMHSNNQENILKAGSSISVSRFIVNAPCATTAGGNMQNGLPFTNTLGCGSWGNNSISENFTYKHLLNITRVASISPKVELPTDEMIWN